jgi:hypothetical protein
VPLVRASSCLVHHVRRDENRLSLPRKGVEHVPELAAQDGVEADGRFVEHEQVGVTEQGDRERRARAFASRECAHVPIRQEVEVEPFDDAVDGLRRDAENAGEVPQVCPHRQVGVHRRCLRQVSDAVPELPSPGGSAMDRDGAAVHFLHTDDCPHQGRLAGPRRPDQAGDEPRRNRGRGL